jgi:hypothetical protein
MVLTGHMGAFPDKAIPRQTLSRLSSSVDPPALLTRAASRPLSARRFRSLQNSARWQAYLRLSMVISGTTHLNSSLVDTPPRALESVRYQVQLTDCYFLALAHPRSTSSRCLKHFLPLLHHFPLRIFPETSSFVRELASMQGLVGTATLSRPFFD